MAKTLDFKYKTFDILTKTFEILTQTYKLLTKNFEILTKTSENLRTWYFVENHRDFNQHLCDFTQNLRYFDHPPPHKSTDLILFSLNQGTVYTYLKKNIPVY